LNYQFLLFTALLLIPLSSISQRSRTKGKTIKATTGIQFSYASTNYIFSPITQELDPAEIDLTFLTVNSGTFEIIEGETLIFELNGEFSPSSFHTGIGLGVQIMNAKNNFHEISLTRFSFSESTRTATASIISNMGRDNFFILGFSQKTFSLGLRYQIGRYLGDPSSVTRFGVAIVLDPVYLRSTSIGFSSNDFPISSHILNLHLGITPLLNFKFSNRVSLTTKLIPQIRIVGFERVREENPTVPTRLQLGSLESGFNYFSLSGAITLEYTLKEPKSRRR